jgi:pyridoxal phosphate enzyme (YggS family)
MNLAENLRAVAARIETAAQHAGHAVRLVAVSKTKPSADIARLVALGQRAFGENYVQEALGKQRELGAISKPADIEWHMIGPLQSNKAREVAQHFDWLQTLDRAKLIAALDRLRPADTAPLNVLIQVNIDDEASKSGCAPDEIDTLAAAIVAAPRLKLRGLMAIPAPADRAQRVRAFTRMRELYDTLRAAHTGLDTLSMGMSDDFELAIEHGATLVRVGSALFGARA